MIQIDPGLIDIKITLLCKAWMGYELKFLPILTLKKMMSKSRMPKTCNLRALHLLRKVKRMITMKTILSL